MTLVCQSCQSNTFTAHEDYNLHFICDNCGQRHDTWITTGENPEIFHDFELEEDYK